MTTTDILKQARKASTTLLALSDSEIQTVLRDTSDALVAATTDIIEANARDLARLDKSNPKYDRLMLTPERIAGIADDMRSVAALPSPRRELERTVRPNGLVISKVAVPFGLIGVIYEARPNVTADVFGLCFRSANACVLKGGHDAADSNESIINVIHRVLTDHGIDPAVATLLPPTREATDILLAARGIVDLIIPRGSSSLINSVREKSKVPVIETGAGVCHCYVDRSADPDMASKLIFNAKTRRVSVCNALDCAVIHADMLGKLPEIIAPLAEKNVKVMADERAFAALSGKYPDNRLFHASDSDFGTEFLDYKMAIKTVGSLDEAIAHIAAHGSGHSESIVTKDSDAAARFQRDIDASCVYVNAPTSFTDGAQFGLGAEIGISTQKLHARGPMALAEIMTYKWLINGNGQTRP